MMTSHRARDEEVEVLAIHDRPARLSELLVDLTTRLGLGRQQRITLLGRAATSSRRTWPQATERNPCEGLTWLTAVRGHATRLAAW